MGKRNVNRKGDEKNNVVKISQREKKIKIAKGTRNCEKTLRRRIVNS